MQPNLLALGKKVREARKRLGITQQHLAEKVDCSPEWVSKIERGRALPSLGCITSIGHVLGTDLTLLLEVSGHDESGPNGLPELGASLIRALDHDGQQIAICLLEALLRRKRNPRAGAEADS